MTAPPRSTEPALTLGFDPPLGFDAQRTRITNHSRGLATVVRDVDGREHRIGPGESIEGTFVLGGVGRVP